MSLKYASRPSLLMSAEPMLSVMRRGDNSDKEHERHERRRSQPAPSLTMWRRSQSRRRQRFQFKDEIVSGLKSLLRPFREAMPHDPFELRRDAGQLRWLVVQNCAD